MAAGFESSSFLSYCFDFFGGFHKQFVGEFHFCKFPHDLAEFIGLDTGLHGCGRILVLIEIHFPEPDSICCVCIDFLLFFLVAFSLLFCLFVCA